MPKRRTSPHNISCPNCGQIYYVRNLQAKYRICPRCGESWRPTEAPAIEALTAEKAAQQKDAVAGSRRWRF